MHALSCPALLPPSARFDDLDQVYGQRVCIGGRSDAWYRQWDFTGGTAPLNAFGQFLLGDAFVFSQVVTSCW